MTIKSTGVISMSDVSIELAFNSNTTKSLNDSDVRSLLGKSSGVISLSDAYGKTRQIQTLQYNVSSNTQQLNITSASIPGYVVGSVIDIVIPAGVYLWSDNIAIAALTISLDSTDTVKITNNGFIMGRGGDGFNYSRVMTAGGPAISTNVALTVDNTNGYIGGGGGGGGPSYSSLSGTGVGAGGGGAGGGQGGNIYYGGMVAGGSIGNVGNNGYVYSDGASGGGGGRIMPGVGANGVTGNSYLSSIPGLGGGAGGSGAMLIFFYGYLYGAGGGGGWGAAGGYGSSYEVFGGTMTSGAGGSANNIGGSASGAGGRLPGAAGGKAINSNGKTITIIGGSSKIYGVIG